MSDPFASAKRSLGRGNYHIFDLAARLNAVGPDNYASFVTEPDPVDPAYEIEKLRFHSLFRDEFPCIVFDAVSNFRACLDQITHTICVRKGLPAEDFAYFPIVKGVSFIENRLNGLKYLPPEIRALYRSFNPYKGGNDTLWGLNELCNIKKHAGLVPINLSSPLYGFQGNSVTGPITIGGTFDPEKNEIDVIRFPVGKKPQGKTEITYAIILHHSEEIINGQHPIFILQGMGMEVGRILKLVEAECERIGVFK